MILIESDSIPHCSCHLLINVKSRSFLCCDQADESEVGNDMLLVSENLFHLYTCKYRCLDQALVASTLLILLI